MRHVLDPLNNGGVQSRNVPSDDVNVIGISFTEGMRGFWSAVPGGEADTDFWNLDSFRAGGDAHLKRFVDAESEGIKKGRTVGTVDLDVGVRRSCPPDRPGVHDRAAQNDGHRMRGARFLRTRLRD